MASTISFQPQTAQRYVAGSSQWHTEAYECFDDIGICLCGTFVPGCLVCKIASDFGECYPCLPLVGGTLIALRTGIRERHRIPGSICEDFLCITYCLPCALCQMARELQARK